MKIIFPLKIHFYRFLQRVRKRKIYKIYLEIQKIYQEHLNTMSRLSFEEKLESVCEMQDEFIKRYPKAKFYS